MTRCGACQGGRFVKPNGPIPCRILFAGESPTKDEVRKGYPFAGRSGAELDHQYLPLSRLARHQVFVTNVVHCPMPGFRNPTHEEALVCARAHLGTELRQVGPDIVVTLGAVAASVFETTYTPGSLGRPVDLETDYGIPTRASFGPWTGWLIPIHRPAAGIHQSRFVPAIREAFSRLPLLIRMLQDESDWRQVEPLVRDPYPHPDYRELNSLPQLDSILSTYSPYQDMAIDTEDDEETGLPWSLQFSLQPGTGYFIDVTRRDLLREFGSWLQHARPLVALHNAPHDLSTMLDMDPPVVVPRWVDTMMLAYHAQLFNHGLKPLAYRLCGMAMHDYDEVVGPPSMAVVESYASQVLSRVESEFQLPHIFKSGKRKGQSELRFPPDTDPAIRDTYNRFKALVRDSQAPDRKPDFDPWKRIFDKKDPWRPEIIEWGESLTDRRIPRRSIVHVPRPDAVYYSVRDSDATLRVLPILRRLCARMGKDIAVYGA